MHLSRHSSFITLCFLALVSTQVAGQSTLTAAEEAEQKVFLNNLQKSLATVTDKKKIEKKIEKKNRVSLSTSYFDKRGDSKKLTGKSVSLSISRKLTATDSVFGYAFSSVRDTASSGNRFDGDSYGLGGGYARILSSGLVVNGSMTLSRSHGSGLSFATSIDIPRSSSKNVSFSLGASKPIVLNTRDVFTPSMTVSQSYSNKKTPGTTLSSKFTLARLFSEKLKGSVFVGGKKSLNKDITLAGSRAYASFGFGANYFITNQVSIGGNFTREESSGGHRGNSGSLSISTPF